MEQPNTVRPVVGSGVGVTVEFAGVWRRFFVSIFDALFYVVPLIIVLVLFVPLGLLGPLGVIIDSLLGIAAIAWLFFYAVYFVGKRGQTLAMSWFGLRVIRMVEPQRTGIGFGLALVRYLFFVIVNPLVLNLGTWWMLINRRRQTWRDMVCKTAVIYDPQKQFAISSVEAVPLRKRQVVWFVVVLVILGWGAVGSATLVPQKFVTPESGQPNRQSGNSTYVNSRYKFSFNYPTSYIQNLAHDPEAVGFYSPSGQDNDVRIAVTIEDAAQLQKADTVCKSDPSCTESTTTVGGQQALAFSAFSTQDKSFGINLIMPLGDSFPDKGVAIAAICTEKATSTVDCKTSIDSVLTQVIAPSFSFQN